MKTLIALSLITALLGCSKNNNIKPPVDKSEPYIVTNIAPGAISQIDSIQVNGLTIPSYKSSNVQSDDFPLKANQSTLIKPGIIDTSAAIQVYLHPGAGEILYYGDDQAIIKSIPLDGSTVSPIQFQLSIGLGIQTPIISIGKP